MLLSLKYVLINTAIVCGANISDFPIIEYYIVKKRGQIMKLFEKLLKAKAISKAKQMNVHKITSFENLQEDSTKHLRLLLEILRNK